MIKNYFKLFANCIPVKGKDNALIYDFQKYKFYKISNELADLLPLIQNIEIEQIQNNNKDLYSTLSYLIDEELGFITSHPEKFPDLNETWETPSFIDNAIIEFHVDTNHKLPILFSNLADLKCNFIALKFQYKPSYELLTEILDFTLKFEFKYIEIWLIDKIKNYELKKIIKSYKMVRKFKIFNAKNKISRSLYQTEINYYSYPTFQDFCKKEQTLFNLNYSFYCESRKYNNCLNKKVSIDYHGNIKNCLYLEKCYGNINENNLVAIVKSGIFQEIWNITKDKIEDCKLCEYRYSCSDCRAFTLKENLASKQTSCNLNP